MDWLLGFLFVIGILSGMGAALILRPVRAARREARFAEACRAFHCQRERLEAKFVQLRLAGATPDAPRWNDCDFDDDVAYARNRSTGELSAFVAVTVESRRFDRCSAGTPDPEAGYAAATAIFRFDGRRWETDGRAIFNVTPTEAIHLCQRDLEMVGREVAGRP